jgi:hypothetical protein
MAFKTQLTINIFIHLITVIININFVKCDVMCLGDEEENNHKSNRFTTKQSIITSFIPSTEVTKNNPDLILSNKWYKK